ncbi:hypothetical protein BH11CYA1_BH11CYA1_30500 [soil metagenome]
MTDDKKALRDFVAGARAMARKKKLMPTEAALTSQESGPESIPEEELVCCKGVVHIAYRGVADDRMYLSYSRQWKEIRFFRPNGLRVFCADCRHRVL